MSLAAWELQRAVYAALTAALDPVPVYDDVPAGATGAYVTVGEMTAADASDKTQDGEDHTLTLHVWSTYPGKKEVKELMARIKAALHDQPLAIVGHDLVSLRFEFATDFLDPDGITRHGVIRFGAFTTPSKEPSNG